MDEREQLDKCEGSRKRDGNSVRMTEDIWCNMRLGFVNMCEDLAQRVEFSLYGHLQIMRFHKAWEREARSPILLWWPHNMRLLTVKIN